VFLFSDNVAIEDEVDLKRRARERDLLVMGPDCGTSIVNGVGLGFANVVRRGRVGVVGASGTGIQEVVSLLHQAGEGISHALGTGSRDLHRAVGGITTLQAIQLLAADHQTETIVLVSKPSDPGVARQVLVALAATAKPAVAYLQGVSFEAPSGVWTATSLEATSRLAAARAPSAAVRHGDVWPPPIELGAGQRQVRGLFCGGTLCQEAAAVVNQGASSGHQFVDFGDDQYTRGRAHPMLDPTLRNHAIVQAGADATVAVLLLDFVLGLGTHPDPAGAAAPAIRKALARASSERRHLRVIGHVVGTDRDPQDLARQEATLRAAGVLLFPSNHRAALAARDMVGAVAA
jgi:FdrA protein